jgi:hypothetical protein
LIPTCPYGELIARLLEQGGGEALAAGQSYNHQLVKAAAGEKNGTR